MRTVSAGLTALIASTNPVLTSLPRRLLSWRAHDRSQDHWVVLGIAGVAFIVESRVANASASMLGIGLVMAGLMSLVAGTILFKRFAPSTNLAVGNGVQTLAAPCAGPFRSHI